MRWNASFNNKNVEFEQLPEQKSDGSGGGAYDVNLVESDGVFSLDKTFEEITTAVKAGMIVRVIKNDRYFSSAKSDTKNNTKGPSPKANAMFFYLNYAASNTISFSCLDGTTNIIVTLWGDDSVEITEVTFSEG